MIKPFTVKLAGPPLTGAVKSVTVPHRLTLRVALEIVEMEDDTGRHSRAGTAAALPAGVLPSETVRGVGTAPNNDGH